jgi:hypothetical protein
MRWSVTLGPGLSCAGRLGLGRAIEKFRRMHGRPLYVRLGPRFGCLTPARNSLPTPNADPEGANVRRGVPSSWASASRACLRPESNPRQSRLETRLPCGPASPVAGGHQDGEEQRGKRELVAGHRSRSSACRLRAPSWPLHSHSGARKTGTAPALPRRAWLRVRGDFLEERLPFRSTMARPANPLLHVVGESQPQAGRMKRFAVQTHYFDIRGNPDE